jgi:diketogulonate reductase-like aldo/keto reductase
MRTVNLFDGTPLPVIGLGTWTMGGRMQPDRSQDERALRALAAALEMGYTHIDTAEMYANGHAEELVGQALQSVNRDDIFLTTKVRPGNLDYRGVHRSLDGSLARLGMETVDLFLIHWPSSSTPLAETFRALNEAVADGRVRYLGVSNFDLDELKEARSLSKTPIVTNQVPYSVATRTYVHNGVIPYCQEHDIVITAYSPVEEGRLRVQTELEAIARTHGATPYQIALAWLANQPGVITIPMSHDAAHLRQNLEAGAISLSDDDMARLTGG